MITKVEMTEVEHTIVTGTIFHSEGREYHICHWKGDFFPFDSNNFVPVCYESGNPYSHVVLLKLNWKEKIRMFFNLGLGRDVEKEYKQRVKESRKSFAMRNLGVKK